MSARPRRPIVPPPRWARVLAAALPILCIASPLTDRPPPPSGAPPPLPHAVDVWLGEHAGVSVSPEWGPPGPSREPIAFPLFKPKPLAPVWRADAPAALGDGFAMVGSVAVLAGDDFTVNRRDTGFGLATENLKEVSRRFIRAFGDDYDQIAVFLGFTDRLSFESLAYQMPVKNDVLGLGLNLFDASGEYGSPSGRMQTMLNMKRISVYKRDVADNPEDVLYPIWAQEAAHRWLTYFRYRLPGDSSNREDLLGRQKAHWARWVHSEASVMDGLAWTDNGDGTFSISEREKRFGTLDQYAMGLRSAAEVPPFFILDNFFAATGEAVARTEISIANGRKYKAQRTNVTVEDIARAVGKREPESGGAAVDLRMGVVFLAPPGVSLQEFLGEAFLVDQTRAPWDSFYNVAGGGRGKVCTELLRPCRGPAFSFGEAAFVAPTPNVLPAPGDRFTFTVPVTNVGDEAGEARVTARPRFGLRLDQDTVASAPLAPGQAAIISFSGQLLADAPCGYPIAIDLEAPGRLGPSRGNTQLLAGLTRVAGSDFETADGAWTINPDGTDTAIAGAWEVGTPEKTVASVLKNFVIQPAGAYSGTRALVTGAAAGPDESANDLDFDRLNPVTGRTTVQSPVMNLAGAGNPLLSYRVHFTAIGFKDELLIPAANDNLQLLGSADGTNWVELDRLTGFGIGWQRRLVDLAAKFGGIAPATLSLRFVAEDDAFENNPVEAVIDDVFVHARAATCVSVGPPPVDPPGTGGSPPVMSEDDGGCRVGGAGQGGFWLALAALVLHRRRRVQSAKPNRSST